MTSSNESSRDERSENSNLKVGVALAAGAAALGAAAAGYYFYGSKDAEKHRKQVASWSTSFKKQVMRELEHTKKFDRATITAAIDRALAVYEGLRAVDTAALWKAAQELKEHWQDVAKEFADDHSRRRSLPTRSRNRAKSTTTSRSRTKKE